MTERHYIDDDERIQAVTQLRLERDRAIKRANLLCRRDIDARQARYFEEVARIDEEYRLAVAAVWVPA
jgi:hypothetical protein